MDKAQLEAVELVKSMSPEQLERVLAFHRLVEYQKTHPMPKRIRWNAGLVLRKGKNGKN